jgi:AraC-like DNA-binding protein
MARAPVDPPKSLPLAALPRLLFAGRFAASTDVPFHRHAGIELVLVTSGACSITVDGEALHGGRGTAFVLPAAVEHDQVNHGRPVRTTYLVFAAPQLTFAPTPRVLDLAGDERCSAWIEDLCQLFHGPEPAADSVSAGLLHAVLERLNELDHRQGSTQALPAPLARAVRYLERRQLDDLDMAEVARHAGVSESHLRALFRSRFGCGPLKYQLRLRLQLAAKLLRNSSLGVGEVAVACGFADANYFARIFRAHHGLPPTGWRRHALPNQRS